MSRIGKRPVPVPAGVTATSVPASLHSSSTCCPSAFHLRKSASIDENWSSLPIRHVVQRSPGPGLVPSDLSFQTMSMSVSLRHALPDAGVSAR